MRQLSGQRFGNLVAISQSGRTKSGGVAWLCICDCGEKKIVASTHLVTGHTKTCGCGKNKNRHGETGTKRYRAWQAMKNRCNRKSHTSFRNYGKRGITYAAKWETYEGFCEDVPTPISDDLSLDRIDNDRNYEPGNVRWATKKQQMRNTRCNRVLSFGGESFTVAEWAEKLGMSSKTLSNRLNQYGWTVEKALTTPVKGESE